MTDLLGRQGQRLEPPPPCKCGSTRYSQSVVADHFFCLDCGELLEPSERTDDPRQGDMLA